MEIVILIVSCLCLVALFLFLRHRGGKENILSDTIPEAQPLKESTQTASTPGQPVQEQLYENVAEVDKDEEKIVTSNKQLIANLHRVLEEEKVFLRPEIRIDDVAKMLLTNRTYVTRLMRQEYGLTFIEYVNVARIQYSQKLLYSTDMTLDEVAEQSGFLSTSNYCRAFKRYIGSSPHSWLQKVK